MREEIYTNLVLKELNGEINDMDLQKLKEWLSESVEHEEKYAEIQKIWKLSGEGQDIINMNIAQEWSRFQQRIQKNEVTEQPTKVRTMWSKHFLKAVAAVFFISMSFWMYKMVNSGNDIKTIYAKAEKIEIKLPDNSVVWLNKDSEITYSEKFEKRLLQLKGEAFFDVQKKNGAIFTIETAQTKTQVLGTSFNVRAYENESTTEVVVVTGKVSFDGLGDDKEPVLLLPDDKGVYKKSSKELEKENNKNLNVLAWKQNKLRFKGELLEQIIPLAETFYNIKVTVKNPAILKCDFNGTFDQLTADEAIESLAYGLSLQLKKKANGYELSGKGCE